MESCASSLHRWKPDYNLRREEYWDRIMHKFSCARGSGPDTSNKETTSEQEDPLQINKEIIKELEKLKALYQSDGQRGKVLGYGKAISMLKSFKEPIRSAKQLDQLPYVGEGIKKKI